MITKSSSPRKAGRAAASTALACLFFLLAPALWGGEPLPSLSTEATTTENLAALSVRAFDGPSELKGNFGGAEVSINHIFVGKAPYATEALAPGTYLIGVEAEGYYPQEFLITVAEKTRYKLVFQLVHKTGFLLTTVLPGDAELIIDGRSLGSGPSPRLDEIRTGSHRLTLKRFAYREKSWDIVIFDRVTTTVNAVLEEAPFEVSELRASRKAFDPRNAASLGRANLSFTVSSYGSGSLEILDASGRKVASFDFPSFTTWNHGVTWRGKDEEGQVLPDGDYRLRLSATPAASYGAASPSPILKECRIALDSSLAVTPYGIARAMPGLLLFPDPRPIPAGVFSINLSSSAPESLFSPSGSDEEAGAGFDLAIAYSFGKLGLALSLGEWDIASSSLGAALSLRGSLGSDQALAIAIFARGELRSCLDAGGGQDYGSGSLFLEAGLPLGLGFGPFRFGLEPGAYASLPFTASGMSSGSSAGPELRAGLWAESRLFQAGISALARSSFASPFDIDWPIEAAAEFRTILDPAPLILSGTVEAAIGSAGSADFSFGLGLGLLL